MMTNKSSNEQPVVPATAASQSQLKWYIAIIVAVLVSAGAGLVVGMQLSTSGRAVDGQMGQQASGPGGMGPGGMMRGGFGTVTDISDDSVTIESNAPMGGQQGSSSTMTYTITADTKITDSNQTASVSDISTGDTVMIQSSDDGKTATSIELNPQMRGGPGTAGRSTSSSTGSEG